MVGGDLGAGEEGGFEVAGFFALKHSDELSVVRVQLAKRQGALPDDDANQLVTINSISLTQSKRYWYSIKFCLSARIVSLSFSMGTISLFFGVGMSPSGPKYRPKGFSHEFVSDVAMHLLKSMAPPALIYCSTTMAVVPLQRGSHRR